MSERLVMWFTVQGDCWFSRNRTEVEEINDQWDQFVGSCEPRGPTKTDVTFPTYTPHPFPRVLLVSLSIKRTSSCLPFQTF